MFKQRRVKTPTLIQLQVAECGAAALGIILAHHGRYVPMAELREACGVSRNGSKAVNVLRAAERYGLEAGGFSCPDELDMLNDFAAPYIMYWRFNHFVVVEGADRRGVFVNDPASGHRCVAWDEFDQSFTGVILNMTPGPDFKTGGRPFSVVPTIRRLLAGNLWTLIFCLMCGLLLVATGLIVPACSMIFVDEIVSGDHANWLRPLLLAMTAATILQFWMKHLQLQYLRRVSLTLSTKVTGGFLWHLLRLPISFYLQRYPGEVAGRSLLCEKLANTLTGQLAETLIDVLTMIIYAGIMLSFAPTLTLIGIAVAGCSFLALKLVANHRTEANMVMAQEDGKVMSTAIAGLHGIEGLKASGLEAGWLNQWAGKYTSATNSRQQLILSDVVLGSVPALLQGIAMAIILFVGTLRVMNGDMSIGMLVAFQSLMLMFLAPVASLVSLGGSLQEIHGDILRLSDVLENEQASIKTPFADVDDLEFPQQRLRGDVRIDGLTFGYGPLDPPRVVDFDCHLNPGNWLAIVGSSGSGKSTVAKVVAGLFEPWHGTITFDGRERTELSQAVLTHSIAVVDQDVMLFEGSIRDNLTLWDNTIDDKDLVQACLDAAIHDDIMSLPNGYDSSLTEGGSNLSGGQRQRLEIARALVRNPSILVLDEATSALDGETERVVNERLRRRGCTCLMIAHRLSTFRHADEIILLTKGRVSARGRHNELLGNSSDYAQLVAEGN